MNVFSKLITAILFAVAASSPAMAESIIGGPTKNVPLNDYILSGGNNLNTFPPSSQLEVKQKNGKPYVVVMAWSEHHSQMIEGEIIKLDSRNQFAPQGMRWLFTLTPEGYLIWVKQK